MGKMTRSFRAGTERVSAELVSAVSQLARPLQATADLDPLVDRIGDAHYVLVGEASHGTAEYYAWRAELSRRLIREKGFTLIAVEGDWPDCYRINRFVKGRSDTAADARSVLEAFDRWPTWMWANEEVRRFIEWLRDHNRSLPEEKQVGFYGLDVYSLWESLYAVLGYLREHDPAGVSVARRAFQCFEPYGEDVQEYAQASHWVDLSCEDEVIALLQELRRRMPTYPTDGREDQFAAEQNALVIKNAEAYYRTMVRGGPASWNIRDRHMTETLERLHRFHGSAARGIVWEHNTHIGDARYTDMIDDGTVNVGQLIRERHAAEGVVLVGFGSHRGSVIAAPQWGAPHEIMHVPQARPGSWEDVFHNTVGDDCLVVFPETDAHYRLAESRGHRAIGVVYHPQYEQYGNYVPTILPRRYDAFLYLDQTEALHPLPVRPRVDGEVPETYPSGV